VKKSRLLSNEEDLWQMETINAGHIREAVLLLQQAVKVLETTLANAERARPDPPPTPSRVAPRRSSRLIRE
jgi:hypothetical protein